MLEEIKQVLVYRRDLKMRKGKIASQIAHAAMKVFFDRGRVMYLHEEKNYTRVSAFEEDDEEPGECVLVIPLTEEMRRWVQGLFTKIVLTVDSEEDLLRARSLAEAAGFPVAQVTDAGITEFKITCPECGGSGTVKNIYLAAPCHKCGGKGKIPTPTNTAIAIGPDVSSSIDEITGRDGEVPTRLP